MSIYKACDIRGRAATELSPQLYERWGVALARQAGAGSTMVAGGDVRGSTSLFLGALAEGMRRGGSHVINLGHLPTPMVYFARRRLHADGCAIVTASHNPAEINGLKWMIGDSPPTPEEVASLAREASPEELAGEGCPGTVRLASFDSDYLLWLQQAFREAAQASLQVVLDPMHGCWAGRARTYLQTVFPHCSFSSLRDTAEPDFGQGMPDPSHPRLLRDSCAKVLREGADLGLAFDGDGDRAALIDEQGIPLRAEEAVWVLLQSFGPELRGSKFVYDLKFSDRIPEAARNWGAEAIVERSGHAFLRSRMRESGALFGAEISGHYFYRALDGGDDALYTACRAIAFLASCGRPLSSLRSACPPVHISPDLRLALDPARHPAVLARIREQWADHPQLTLDGVRIDTPMGWVLVRSSVTEAALTFRFEGGDAGALTRLIREFCRRSPEVGDELLKKLDALP